MTVQEIKEAICGRDENGKSKVVAMIGAHIYDLVNITKNADVIMEYTSLEPAVELRVLGSFATLDLEFDKASSEGLGMFYRALERYLEETDNNSEEHEAVAFINLVPYELGGEYYVTALSPVFWALEPDVVGEPARKLRIVFYADDVAFNESDLDENLLDALMNQAAGGDEMSEEDKELYSYIDETDNEEDYVSLGDERDYDFSNADKYFERYQDDRDDDFDEDDEEEDEDNYDPYA